MAFGPDSRYRDVPSVETEDREGRRVLAVKLRQLPEPTGEEVLVEDKDRLDLLSADHYKQPTWFWHIADANTELEAADLIASGLESGLPIKVPGS